ncbi:hypothetical protein BJV74DRAFT_248482 [Russula compacta]|nr:hypothetical protein BJV74DRAFT_248482 [Russula compacta]
MVDYANLVPVFITLLALGGQVGLPILVLTSFRSKRLSRHSTFVNFCLSLIIYSLAFCILIYSGQHRHAQPNYALCVAQASMIMAVLPMVCVAALVVVLQTGATFQDPGSAIFIASERRSMKFILLATPYATFLAYFLGSILIATSLPNSVWENNGLYCFFQVKAIRHYLGPLSCLVPLAMTAIIEAVIVVQWYRRWKSLKKAFPLADKKAQVLICFRVCLFSAYTLLSLAASILFQRTSTPAVSYLVEAGLPLAAFLSFGTQKDILEAWGIRKAAPSGTSEFATPPQQHLTNSVTSESDLSDSSGEA